MRLQNKIGLITGAGSGIGEATAIRFAQKGARGILTDVDMASVENVEVDITNGCLFLASDESRYMQGFELIIDGGYTCH